MVKVGALFEVVNSTCLKSLYLPEENRSVRDSTGIDPERSVDAADDI
jgi:hypothetical protein